MVIQFSSLCIRERVIVHCYRIQTHANSRKAFRRNFYTHRLVVDLLGRFVKRGLGSLGKSPELPRSRTNKAYISLQNLTELLTAVESPKCVFCYVSEYRCG